MDTGKLSESTVLFGHGLGLAYSPLYKGKLPVTKGLNYEMSAGVISLSLYVVLLHLTLGNQPFPHFAELHLHMKGNCINITFFFKFLTVLRF